MTRMPLNKCVQSRRIYHVFDKIARQLFLTFFFSLLLFLLYSTIQTMHAHTIIIVGLLSGICACVCVCVNIAFRLLLFCFTFCYFFFVIFTVVDNNRKYSIFEFLNNSKIAWMRLFMYIILDDICESIKWLWNLSCSCVPLNKHIL